MTIARGGLTPEQVREYSDALSAHHGEPVMPVSRYCKAFAQWGSALLAKAERDANEDHRDVSLDKIAGVVLHIELAVAKSSLLGRLIYGGEQFRTEMCPEHKGRWSGLGDCPHGCQLTGWLPVATAMTKKGERP